MKICMHVNMEKDQLDTKTIAVCVLEKSLLCDIHDLRNNIIHIMGISYACVTLTMLLYASPEKNLCIFIMV